MTLSQMALSQVTPLPRKLSQVTNSIKPNDFKPNGIKPSDHLPSVGLPVIWLDTICLIFSSSHLA